MIMALNSPADDLVDAVGYAHRALQAGEIPRIVSLVPSITELLIDLGLGPCLVGRTGFCIHPKAVVAAIPKVGGTKDVNIAKIRQLAPTHLIVNIDENEKPRVDELAQFVPHVVVTHPITVADNQALYRLLGAIFGVLPRAEALVQELKAAMQLVQPDSRPLTLAYCIWKDPWMTVSADTYIANLMSLRGWKVWQPEAAANRRYPGFELSQLHCAELDGVLLSSEPYSFTQAHCDSLSQQLQKPVCLVDGEMMSWYGSRAIKGMRYLADLRPLG